MTLWLRATSGSFGTWPYDLSNNPCPTIQACGLGGRQIQQHYLEIEKKELKPMKQDKNKPPYVVPTMEEIRNIKPSGLKVASTFSGAGGSCTGYRMAGFEVVWANEFVPIAQESYKANAAESCYLDKRDIRQIKPEEILERIGMKPGELDLFDGSPPCQAFSTAGKREKGWGKGKKYEHGAVQCNEQLFFDYIRLLRGLKPKVFVAENVSGMLKGTAKGMFLEILKELKESGYKVKCKLLDAQWLGVPQMRQRAIFIGVREDLGIDPAYPLPLKYRYSVRDALPEILKIPSNSIFDDSIKKMKKTDVPSRTITLDSCNGSRCETKQGEKRKFTIQELKKICSFPDDFILKGTYAQQWERLGNSVPPVMMYHIAKTIREKCFM